MDRGRDRVRDRLRNGGRDRGMYGGREIEEDRWRDKGREEFIGRV